MIVKINSTYNFTQENQKIRGNDKKCPNSKALFFLIRLHQSKGPIPAYSQKHYYLIFTLKSVKNDAENHTKKYLFFLWKLGNFWT